MKKLYILFALFQILNFSGITVAQDLLDFIGSTWRWKAEDGSRTITITFDQSYDYTLIDKVKGGQTISLNGRWDESGGTIILYPKSNTYNAYFKLARKVVNIHYKDNQAPYAEYDRKFSKIDEHVLAAEQSANSNKNTNKQTTNKTNVANKNKSNQGTANNQKKNTQTTKKTTTTTKTGNQTKGTSNKGNQNKGTTTTTKKSNPQQSKGTKTNTQTSKSTQKQTSTNKGTTTKKTNNNTTKKTTTKKTN